VESLKSLKVGEIDLMVSFDVVSLYTKILVDDVINVIRRITYKEIASLVEVCLKKTYFSFHDKIYEQNHGVSIVSPLLLIIASFYMEYIEKVVINTTPILFGPIGGRT